MSWIPDRPDARDYAHQHNAVFRLLRKFGCSHRRKLPDEVDLRSDGEVEFSLRLKIRVRSTVPQPLP